MGNINGSIELYGILKERESEKESKSVRHPLHDEFTEFMNIKNYNYYNLYQAFEESCEKYGNNNFLGTRRLDKDKGTYGSYKFKSYNEIKKLCTIIADSIEKLTLYSKFNEKTETFLLLGILSKNREEYIICDMACHLLGITVVPIFDTLNESEYLIIFNETKLEVICLDLIQFNNIIKLIKEKKLIYFRSIILFEEDCSGIYKITAKEQGINLYTYTELINLGKVSEKKVDKFNSNSTAVLCYTGWTSDRPKAAKLSHRSILSYIYAMSYCLMKNKNKLNYEPNNITLNDEDKLLFKDPSLTKDIKKILTESNKPTEESFSDKDIYISYISIANSIERIIITLCIHNGLSIGFFTGESKRLFEDIQILNPTIFFGPPRIYNKINEALREIIHNLNSEKKTLVEKGINSKTENFKNTGQLSHYLWDKLVFNKIKRLMGEKLRFMLTTSSMIPDSVLDFLKICFSCPIIQGYSQTEFLAAALFTNPYDYTNGHAGGPALGFELKLVDLPNYGYFSTDYKNDEDRPRGEIYLKGPSLFSGYLYEDNKCFIDQNGWTKTGVIGMLNLKNNSVKVIDKVDNLIDLIDQGIIEPERLENIYVNSKYIKQIFIQEFNCLSLIAMIIPNKEELLSSLRIIDDLKETNFDGMKKRKQSFENDDKRVKINRDKNNYYNEIGKKDNYKEIDFCNNNEIIDIILKDLDLIAKVYKLRKCELIKKIIIISDTFIFENGLLTPTLKVKRKFVAKYFYELINKLINNN